MNEQFKAILPLGKKWSVTDEGIGYKDDFYPYDEVAKVKKISEAGMFSNGVINVDLKNGKFLNLVYDKKDKVAECKKAKNAPAPAELSSADELLKFKNLLDMGIITQEEFDTKKKQILGL